MRNFFSVAAMTQRAENGTGQRETSARALGGEEERREGEGRMSATFTRTETSRRYGAHL